MPDITNPHDRFFEAVFSNEENARDFVASYLPAPIVAGMDLGTLEPTKDSFIDDELRRHFSDLLFRVRLKTGRGGFVYLLFEHKAQPELMVGFQLLRYSVRIWEQYGEGAPSRTLPPHVSVVLYHGRRPWQVSPHFRSLFDAPEVLLFQPEHAT
jgi:predicted transposase YdaD